MSGRVHAQGAVFALAAGLASLCCLGYSFRTAPNVLEFLPFIRAAADPSLYGGDPFVATRAFFPSLFPGLMALFPYSSLETAHFLLYLLLRWVFLFLVWELGLELFKSRASAALGTLLLAFSPQAALMSFLGEDPVMKTSLYQTSAAMPFALAAFLCYFKGLYPAAFLSLGAMYFLNGLAANYTACALLADTVLRKERSVVLLKGWAVFAPVALLWFIMLPKGNMLPPPGDEFIPALKMWYSGHYFPFLWKAEKWTRALFVVALFGGVLYAGGRNSRHGGILGRFMLSVAVLWGVGFVVGAWFPIRQLVVLQFFRADTVFLLFALLCAGDAAVRFLREGSLTSCAAGGLLLAAAVDIGTPPLLPFAALLLLAHHLRSQSGRIACIVGWAVPAAFLLVVFKQQAFTLRTAVFLLFSGIYLYGLHTEKKLNISFRLRAAALCSLALLPFLPAAYGRMAMRSLEFRRPWEADLQAAAAWAEANTAKDSLFLVPPETMGFRALSGRPSFVEWLDGGAMHWVPGYSRLWLDRLDILWAVSAPGLAGDAPPMDGQARVDAYYAIAPHGFEALSSKYGIRYVLTRSDVQLPFTPAFAARSWTVYQLE